MQLSSEHLINILIITVTVGFLLPSFYFLIKSYRKKKHIALCRKIFERLFFQINATEVSQQDRTKITVDEYGLGYGEITFEGFSNMLAVAQPKTGEIFYDLGAGAGKAIFCAALLYDLKKCCGIELLNSLHQLSLNQLSRFRQISQIKKNSINQHHPIQFIHGDLLAQDISDANIIFINATCFHENFWHKIVEKLHSVKVGTRIIIASKYLNENQYRLLDAQMLPMSWGISSVRIYQKIDETPY